MLDKWTLSRFNDHAFIEGKPWTVQILLCMKVYVSRFFFFGSRESSPLGHDDDIAFGIVRSLMEVLFGLFFCLGLILASLQISNEYVYLNYGWRLYCGQFQLHRHFGHWIGLKKVSCGYLIANNEWLSFQV